MITTAGLNKITEIFKGLIVSATCTIGSIAKDIVIDSITQTGNSILVKLYLDDNISGTTTKFQLKATDGTVLIDRPDNIVKPNTKGLYVMFNVNIQEVVING